MSARAESKTDAQRSQFASLTMRLKDKLHPPRIRRSAERIKRTQSQRAKPAELELSTHTPRRKSVCVLAEQERAVVSSLQYFKALVDRLGVDRLGVDRLVLDQSAVGGLLGGASGRVLEAVQTLVQLEPRLHNSKTVSSCLSRLYRSLAQLIRWADQVMLQGVARDDKEATATVTMVIRAVLDGVKELVRLAAERQDGSSPSSPVQSQPAVSQPGGCEGRQTSGRTRTSPNPGAPTEEEEEEEEEGRKVERKEEKKEVSAPPKPPKPLPQPSAPPTQQTDRP
uniref:rap guanine nucleotide exchange factor 1-like n=1 Tax=Centroberyx gerrardi TaxID=166262 RepID=UPI003AB0D207